MVVRNEEGGPDNVFTIEREKERWGDCGDGGISKIYRVRGDLRPERRLGDEFCED